MNLAPPFTGDNMADLFRNIERKNAKPITSVYSPTLRNLCMKLLIKNREERPFIDQILDEFPKSYSLLNDPINEPNMSLYKNARQILDRKKQEIDKRNPAKIKILDALSPEITELKSAIFGEQQKPKTFNHKRTSIKDLISNARKELGSKLYEYTKKAKPRSTSLCTIQKYDTIQKSSENYAIPLSNLYQKPSDSALIYSDFASLANFHNYETNTESRNEEHLPEINGKPILSLENENLKKKQNINKNHYNNANKTIKGFESPQNPTRKSSEILSEDEKNISRLVSPRHFTHGIKPQYYKIPKQAGKLMTIFDLDAK